MKSVLRVGLLAGCLSVTAGAARAEDVKQVLTAQYKKIAEGFMKRDAKAVMALGTKDFKMTMMGQTSTGDQVKQQLEMQFKMMKPGYKVQMNVDKVTVTGNKAVVMSSGSGGGKMDLGGKVSTIKETSLTKDTWVKTAQGWKIASVEVVKSDMWADGKKFDPMSMGAPPEAHGPNDGHGHPAPKKKH